MKYSYTFRQINPDRLHLQVSYTSNNHQEVIKNFVCEDFSETNIHFLATNYAPHIVTGWEKIDGLSADDNAISSNNFVGVTTKGAWSRDPDASLDNIPFHNEYTHYTQQREPEQREDGNWYVGYDVLAYDANTVIQNVIDDAHSQRKTSQYNGNVEWTDSSNTTYVIELGQTDRISLSSEVVNINNNIRVNPSDWRMLKLERTYHANGTIATTQSVYEHRSTTNQEIMSIANTVAQHTQKLFDVEKLMISRAESGNTNPDLWSLCSLEVSGT